MENIYMNYTELHFSFSFALSFRWKWQHLVNITIFLSTTIQGQKTFSRMDTVLRHECTEVTN